MGGVTTKVLGFTRVSVIRKGTSRQQTKGQYALCGGRRKVLRGEGACELKPKREQQKCSESSKATVQLGKRKLALTPRARTTTGSTAFPPWLLALVRVRKEGQRRSGLAGTVDDGYGRVARRREVRWIWGEAVDVRLVRFGRGQVRDELRQLLMVLPNCWVRRGHRGLTEGVWVVRSSGLRTLGVRGHPLLRGGSAFARRGVCTFIALGQGTGVREDDDRSAVVDGRRVGEVRLTEARSGREVHALAHDGGT